MLAALTSVWLRSYKKAIVLTIEEAFLQKFYFTKKCVIFRCFESYLIPFFKTGSVMTPIRNVRFDYTIRCETRLENKKTMFNNLGDAAQILLVYIGVRQFGFSGAAVLSFGLCLLQLVVMFALDLIIVTLKQTGLAYWRIIDRDTKRL